MTYDVPKDAILVAMCYDARVECYEAKLSTATTVKVCLSEPAALWPELGWIPLRWCANEEHVIEVAQEHPGEWVAILLPQSAIAAAL